MSLALRRYLWVTGSVLLAWFAIAPAMSGCGRSSLEQALFFEAGVVDSSAPTPDAGSACGPSTCPSGCCDASGSCRAGSDVDACGREGASCAECPALGFDTCNANVKSCSKNVDQCDDKTCPSGCCVAGAKGPECIIGTASGACGTAGEACIDCAAAKLACDPTSKLCVAPPCGPENCQGCCVGRACVDGTANQTCGSNGEACTNCAATGQNCEFLFGATTCTGTPSCGPANCDGCCIGDTCIPGADDTACGVKGAQCVNCASTNGVCNAQKACEPKPKCGPGNCAGCCSGDTCVVATTSLACGAGGATCKACGPGNTCNAGVCESTTTCTPASCPTGCCAGGICAIGNQGGACGSGGGACTDCNADGRVCIGNACRVPTCGPANCAGCCQGNTCVVGSQDVACGKGGAACTACGATQTCTAGACQTTCDAATCTGCCQANVCFGGFTSGRCGSGGTACSDCGAGACNVAGLPRVCSAPGTCPSAYPTCPFGVATPKLTRGTGVCTDAELQDASAACSSGADSAGCAAFFAFEKATNPRCGACLTPFDVPFAEFQGIYTCVAPFVTDACNRATGCQSDCKQASCSTCSAAEKDACEAAVTSTNCQTFTQQASCVVVPLFGAGLFCNPANPAYGGNFGAWLAGVGAEYCGP